MCPKNRRFGPNSADFATIWFHLSRSSDRFALGGASFSEFSEDLQEAGKPCLNDSADGTSFLIVIVFCSLRDGVLPDEVSTARRQTSDTKRVDWTSALGGRACERVRKRLRFFARGRSGGAAAARADLSAGVPAAAPLGWSIRADLLPAPDCWGALP